MEFLMFSKAAQGRTVETAVEAALNMGFDGLDLVCRSEGHILPQNATADMENTLSYIRSRGLSVPMLTTGYTSATQPYVREVFATAGQNGIKYIKLGYWPLDGYGSYEKCFNNAMSDLDELEALAKETGVCVIIHPHQGRIVFSGAFQIRDALKGRDTRYIGAFTDPGNFAADGLTSAWILGMEILAPYTKVVAIKNYRPELGQDFDDAHWVSKLCPYSEGIVDFKLVFEMLRKQNFDGCISVYGGYFNPKSSFKVMTVEENLVQLEKDFEFLKECIEYKK